MLSRNHRFRGRRAIGEVHRRGLGSRGRLFGVKVLPNPRNSTFRVAIVVSKKVSKSAVTRNRIRRRLFACFGQEPFSKIGPFDIVVNVFDVEILKDSPDGLADKLQKQLSVAGVFK